MSKDLSKVKAGDFVRYGDNYGLVIDTFDGLQIIYGDCWGLVTDNPNKEFRRLKNPSRADYIVTHWKRSFKKAKPIFSDTIEVDIRINGKQANLSDISEETLIKLRKEN